MPKPSTRHEGRPIIRDCGDTIGVLCPMGHVYTSMPKKDWPGSWLEARAADPEWVVWCDGAIAKDALFIAVMTTGLVYCDTRREENGDYVRVAYLNYGTLELDVYKPKSDLLPRIRQDAEAMQAKRSQEFAIAGNMTITLGKVTR